MNYSISTSDKDEFRVLVAAPRLLEAMSNFEEYLEEQIRKNQGIEGCYWAEVHLKEFQRERQAAISGS